MGVPAKHLSKEEFRSGNMPGSFHVSPPDPTDGEQTFWYCCPCGCGAQVPLTVGNGFKPADGPSWNWNGSIERPTLSPSVNHIDHWHGWLRDGVWELA